MTSRRLPGSGTWIDRSQPIGFRFDGGADGGVEGDTRASALLATGVVGGFRARSGVGLADLLGGDRGAERPRRGPQTVG
jgi:hypothetical protein